MHYFIHAAPPGGVKRVYEFLYRLAGYKTRKGQQSLAFSGFMKGFDFSAYTLLKQFMIKHPEYAVYVLLSLKDQQFYIGYTSDFKRRMEEHEHGKSKSTACRRPFICVFVEYYLGKSDALRREKYFKTSGGKRVLRLMLTDSLQDTTLPKLHSLTMSVK